MSRGGHERWQRNPCHLSCKDNQRFECSEEWLTITNVPELRTQETNNSVGPFLPNPSLLGRLHQGQPSHQSLEKHLTLL